MKCSHGVATVLLTILGNVGPAAGVDRERNDVQSAVSHCQVALPRGGDAFRKRPLGVANEGSTTAFLNCAWLAETSSSTGFDGIFIFFSNRGATTAAVSCTLVDGVPAPLGASVFFPKTFPVSARGSSGLVGWGANNDNGGRRFKTPALSCAMPPGVEINATQILYTTNVGG